MIESPQNKLVKIVRALHTPHMRKKQKLLLLEGPTSIDEALAAGARLAFALVRGPAVARRASVHRTCRELVRAQVPVHQVEGRLFAALAGTEQPQGIVAAAHEPDRIGVGALAGDDPRPLAVLCGLQDPGNVGACIRTAAAFGMRILVTSGSTDPYSPKVVRAAAGALFRTPLIRGKASPRDEVAALRAAGFQIVCTSRPGERPEALRGAAAGQPLALVIGNEGSGLPPEILALADRRVWIPIADGAESLNAAVAFGILAYVAGLSA